MDYKSQATRCSHPKCDKTTREGKPFCPLHVEDHRYVQHVLAALEARAAEVALIQRQGARAVRVTGPTAREVLSFLKFTGRASVERIAHERKLPTEVVMAVVQVLDKLELVTTGRTRRGSLTVRLIKPEPGNRLGG